MKSTVDVLELLASQHDEVDRLIERLEAGEGSRSETFAELADKLAAHAKVEETLFYPAAMAKQTDELLHEAVEEHLAVKRVLAAMLELDPDEDEDRDEFDAELARLKDQVAHHAHAEEEGKLFPKLRGLMDRDERAALGNEVLAMFEVLLEQAPRQAVPEETGEPAPLPAP
jgi:hypothetical protein